jgi:transcriptional regulator with XRE-family HTH domain
MKFTRASAPAIKALRASGVTPADVARAVGISGTAVRWQLSGERRLSVDVAEMCSRLTGIPMVTLFPRGSYVMTDSERSAAARKR